MASMHYVVVPQHQRGDDPIPTVKQKAAAGGDRKNRRARGDIGNLVMVRGVEGKPQPQISHPVTRSSGAHLLVNAQLTAVATADKKPVVVTADVAVGKGCAKAIEPKVTVKPEPEEIIEISPDTYEPKDQVHDIDALDANDRLAVVDYVEDIYKFYKLAEPPDVLE